MDADLKDLQEAYAKARRNLVNYRRILLQNSEGEEVEAAPFHYDWSDILLNGKKNFAIEAFRESAKTQYVLRAFPLYCLTFPERGRLYIVLIKNNARLASAKLLEIEKEYTTNPTLNANKVRINEESGSVFDVNVLDDQGVEHNVRIEAYGKGSSIRGLSYLDRRPDIVIIDDPQDVEDAKSDTVVESDWKWFLSDVKFLGKKCRIFLIGNNLGEKCIVERVMQNPTALDCETKVLPAILKQKLPDGTEIEVSAWPAQFSIESLKKERAAYDSLGQLEIWQRERMCLSVSDETRVFHESDYQYYSPSIIHKMVPSCNLYATLDPASSKSIEACFRAIVINAVDSDDNWFIADVLYGRWDSAVLLDKIFHAVVTWRPKTFGIEKGMLKQVIEPFIVKKMSQDKVFFSITELEHGKIGSKLERIKMLQPRFKAHKIWFPTEAHWLAEMKSELSGVTKTEIKSQFIDLVDALAMQEQIAQAPYGRKANNALPREAMPD